MLPNINPIIRMAIVSLTLEATMITANNTRKLPKLDAIANEYEVLINCNPIRELPIMSMATPRLAPELIPSTNGPASGFLKSVCINRPDMDKPHPTNMAVSAFGRRYSKMMCCQVVLEADPPPSTVSISSNGMDTEPNDRLSRKQPMSTMISIPKAREYVRFKIN